VSDASNVIVDEEAIADVVQDGEAFEAAPVKVTEGEPKVQAVPLLQVFALVGEDQQVLDLRFEWGSAVPGPAVGARTLNEIRTRLDDVAVTSEMVARLMVRG